MSDETETAAPTRFEHYCTCGGFAHRMNGRPANNPHMDWCPQKEEYDKWFAKYGAGHE